MLRAIRQGFSGLWTFADEAELEAAHVPESGGRSAERTVLDVVDAHSRAVVSLSGRAIGPDVDRCGFTYLAESLSTRS